MQRVEWSDEFLTNIDELDAQHGELFDRMNALIAAARDGRAAAELTDLIDYLERYASEHFALEEVYMEREGYPGASGHREAHNCFRADVERLRRRLNAEPPSELWVQQTTAGLRDWLTTHVSIADRALAEFIRNRPHD